MSALSLNNLTPIRIEVDVPEAKIGIAPLTLESIVYLSQGYKQLMLQIYEEFVALYPKGQEEQDNFLFAFQERFPHVIDILLNTPELVATIIALGEREFFDLESDEFKQEIVIIKNNLSVGSQVIIASEVISLTKDSFVGAGDILKKMIQVEPEDKPANKLKSKVTG